MNIIGKLELTGKGAKSLVEQNALVFSLFASLEMDKLKNMN